MQEVNLVNPPSSWSKYADIYTNEKFETIFICSICPERVNSFADVHSLRDHIGIEHRVRLQVPDASNNVNIQRESNVQTDNCRIKMEPRDERDCSDIHNEQIISNTDRNNPQKEIFQLGLALYEALKMNNANVSQSSVIENCYTMINNYTQQTSTAPSVQHEGHQAPNRPSDDQVASGSTPSEQITRQNIPAQQNPGKNISAPQKIRVNIPAQQNRRGNIPAQQTRSKHKGTKNTVKSKSSLSEKVKVIKQNGKTAKECTRLIKCDECRSTMTYEITYLKHKIEHHTKDGNSNMRRCSTCLELVLKKEFKQHKIKHSLFHTKRCALCSKNFTEQNKLLWHYIRNHRILDIRRRNSLLPPRSI